MYENTVYLTWQNCYQIFATLQKIFQKTKSSCTGISTDPGRISDCLLTRLYRVAMVEATARSSAIESGILQRIANIPAYVTRWFFGFTYVPSGSTC